MWTINTTTTFDTWLLELCDTDRECIYALLIVLRQQGPALSRPYADTLNGSRYRNMKELRIQSKGKPIRVFYAFDPHRSGIVLCGKHKTGTDKRFYAEMLPLAEREYGVYLSNLKTKR